MATLSSGAPIVSEMHVQCISLAFVTMASSVSM